ncbi:MAG: hypothetical protein Q8O51_02355 [bacterium]|nr:hypothetical protein [bacterium]
MRFRQYLTPTNGVLVLLIAFAAAARFWPHPANFAPVAAVALFSGVYLSKRASILAPVIAMVISDIFLGMHNLVFFTWGSMALIGIIGWWVKEKKQPGRIVLGALAGSALFFFITNGAVWAIGDGASYAHNFTGLTQAYVAGLPFLRNTLAGDLVYVGVFFGIAELAFAWERRRVRASAA